MTAALVLGTLQDLGVGWVILGHSERRALMKESSELIADKTGEPGHNNLAFSPRSVSTHACSNSNDSVPKRDCHHPVAFELVRIPLCFYCM